MSHNATIETMDEEELRQAYNANDKPNDYGKELLRRVAQRDREEFGMNAENPALR